MTLPTPPAYPVLAVALALCLPPAHAQSAGMIPWGGQSFQLLRDAVSFTQRDPAWAQARLGASPATIHDKGCMLVALSMAAVNLGEDTDPGRLNAALSERDGFTERGGLVWSAVAKATEGRVRLDPVPVPTPEDIDACILVREGYPLVQYTLKTGSPHWAVIVGKDGQSWLARDPMSDDPHPVPLETLAPEITGARCVYEG